MCWRNMGKRWLFLWVTELKRRERQRYGGKEKNAFSGWKAGQWQARAKAIFFLTGILLCAVPKCIACHPSTSLRERLFIAGYGLQAQGNFGTGLFYLLLWIGERIF